MSAKETTITTWQSELDKCAIKQVSDCLGDIRTIGSLLKASGEKETLLLIENALAPALQFLDIEPTPLTIQFLIKEIFDNKHYSISDLKLLQKRIIENKYYGKADGNQILQVIQTYRLRRLTEAEIESHNKHLERKQGQENNCPFKEKEIAEAKRINKLVGKHKKTHEELWKGK